MVSRSRVHQSNRPTQLMIIDWNTEGVRGVRYIESCARSDTVRQRCYEVSIVRRFYTMLRMLHEGWNDVKGRNDVEGLIRCRNADTMSKY